MTHLPSMKETKFLLPKPALSVRDVKPSQWVNLVQSNWEECAGMTTIQTKAQVLGKVLKKNSDSLTQNYPAREVKIDRFGKFLA